MSTKALRDGAEAIRQRATHPHSESSFYAFYLKMMAEIEAIERASKALASDEVRRALRHAPEDVQAARAMLESIAKEAP